MTNLRVDSRAGSLHPPALPAYAGETGHWNTIPSAGLAPLLSSIYSDDFIEGELDSSKPTAAHSSSSTRQIQQATYAAASVFFHFLFIIL
jgi:hypothetical protein